jgi:hypothetical protein
MAEGPCAVTTVQLYPHPATPCAAVHGIAVDVKRTGASLTLRYDIDGDINALNIPQFILPETETTDRVDELWRHTCFEAFVRASESAEYYEFNFSPTGQWAHYRFDAYRAGMRDEPHVGRPVMAIGGEGQRFLQTAVVCVPKALEGRRLVLALSAVIEEASSAISYWALAHPSPRPDFHHPDSFTLELP